MFVNENIYNSYTVEKSEFIAYLKHIESEEDYKNYLQEIRKKHYDATHVCSAFILGNVKRCSDDGEPSGTAGRPILNVLEKQGLDETCALVVRYFGGIKLGAGGLTRAYSNAVSLALEKATFAKKETYPTYSLKLSYELADKVNYFIENNTLLFKKNYEEEVEFIFGIKEEKILEKIKELTKGFEPLYIKDETIKEIQSI